MRGTRVCLPQRGAAARRRALLSYSLLVSTLQDQALRLEAQEWERVQQQRDAEASQPTVPGIAGRQVVDPGECAGDGAMGASSCLVLVLCQVLCQVPFPD